MIPVKVVFWSIAKGGKSKLPAFPYSCTAIVENVARSVIVHRDGPVEHDIHHDANMEFTLDKNLSVDSGHYFTLYEGPSSVGSVKIL